MLHLALVCSEMVNLLTDEVSRTVDSEMEVVDLVEYWNCFVVDFLRGEMYANNLDMDCLWCMNLFPTYIFSCIQYLTRAESFFGEQSLVVHFHTNFHSKIH